MSNDLRFATLEARKTNEDELERIIEGWALNKTSYEIMQILQSAGVAAGVVQKSEDLHADPQIKIRRHYWEVDHPLIGVHPVDTVPFRLSQSPAQFYRREPLLTEHNEQICTEILRLTEEKFIELTIAGAFGTI